VSVAAQALAATDGQPELGRVVVLAGGLTHERDVSLRSGRRVADALHRADVDAVLLDADVSLLSTLDELRPDAVFIALHGGAGEDGAVRGVLDLVGVPYVGATPDACRMAFDKPSAKAAIRAAGLATPASVALPHTTFRELGAAAVLARLIDRLGLPLMVKPARGGSALGAVGVTDADGLPAAMVTCFSYGDIALVERFVEGTEIAVSVIDTGSGPVALPPVEIAPADGVFDYAARYTAGYTEYFTPARLTERAAAAVADAAILAHQVLGLRDLSRTDLVVDSAGEVHFLEVNVAPGMTETSLLPMAVEAGGLELGALCRQLLAKAARRG